MIEFRQVPEKGLNEYRKIVRIWASTREGVRASTGIVIESGQVLEKGSGKCRKSDRIWASTREGFGRVPE